MTKYLWVYGYNLWNKHFKTITGVELYQEIEKEANKN